MSIQILSLVWKHAPYKGNTLLTLLALADWSDDEGVSWPKLDTVASKSRQSVRSVQYAIEQLSKDGYVEVIQNPGRGNRSEFKINLQKLHHLPTQILHEKDADFARKGAKHDIAIRKNRHDTSLNHQGEQTPDLPVCVLARGILEKIELPTVLKNLLAVTAAIECVMRGQKIEAWEAYDYLLLRALEAKTNGEYITKFWFEDSRWTQQQTSRTKTKIVGNGKAILEGMFSEPVTSGGDVQREGTDGPGSEDVGKHSRSAHAGGN